MTLGEWWADGVQELRPPHMLALERTFRVLRNGIGMRKGSALYGAQAKPE